MGMGAAQRDPAPRLAGASRLLVPLPLVLLLGLLLVLLLLPQGDPLIHTLHIPPSRPTPAAAALGSPRRALTDGRGRGRPPAAGREAAATSATPVPQPRRAALVGTPAHSPLLVAALVLAAAAGAFARRAARAARCSRSLAPLWAGPNCRSLASSGSSACAAGVVWVTAAGSGASTDAEDRPPPPLGYGDIRWLPPCGPASSDTTAQAGEQVLPVFPLNAVHLPGSTHTLNIFEPRYCQLYSDIILNGSRRFVVTLLHPTPLSANAPPPQRLQSVAVSLAEVGVVFYVEDFNKVEEATGGLIKYACTHRVLGRVRLRRVLNPACVLDRKTYLRAVVEDLADDDEGADCTAAEAALSDAFRAVVALHGRLRAAEAVRFADGVALPGNLSERGEGGTFWQTANLWQALVQERLQAFQAARAMGEQAVLAAFLRRRGFDPQDPLTKDRAASSFRFADLPADLQAQYKQLQTDFEEAAEPYVRLLIWFFQALLQESRHERRVALLHGVVVEELRRLQAKASLQAVFREP